MSVPSDEARSKADTGVCGFYGRSFPRASILLDSKNEVRTDRKMAPPSANAPLLGMTTFDLKKLPWQYRRFDRHNYWLSPKSEAILLGENGRMVPRLQLDWAYRIFCLHASQ